MYTPRILLIVTSADHMGDMQTGSWLEEFAAPYYTFLDAKCSVTIASPRGGAAPIDPESLKPENLTASTRRYEQDKKTQQLLQNTRLLSEIDGAEYDALYFSGGHGTMVDFPHDATIRALVEQFYAEHKPIAAVCHGPAALLNAHKPGGSPLVDGRRFTCFTDAEESAVGLVHAVPFLLETKLEERGGIAHAAKPFTAHVVVDGPVMTGQNPASAIPLAEAVIYQLRAHSLVRFVA